MHPAFVAWWRAGRGGSCGPEGFSGGRHAWFGGDCGPGRGGRHRHGHGHGGGGDDLPGGSDFDGPGGFGVRRPLRFLAHRLELDDGQIAELATILDELKIERAQAAVDHRRTTSAFADAVLGEKIDETRLDQIRADRVKSAEGLQAAVVRAIGRIHALLSAEQRKKLAYLLRTGALAI
ncbi:Spy/CpxP family protein refolding chaperone [Polyangium sp. 6x1]|uniref:Spy/CpxP family protein refolding chaperone n=1 Tax=Polyangium sp. 6x1 TaxID=3042689 RepID=UPI0024831827|nr:Spy/CpxP family protein refolding chaperone [Polyangium sp. 6x1]MDI1448722.1 Spy/CpxP family protein refolding chaperone [Polyangium sp. 6x1]